MAGSFTLYYLAAVYGEWLKRTLSIDGILSDVKYFSFWKAFAIQRLSYDLKPKGLCQTPVFSGFLNFDPFTRQFTNMMCVFDLTVPCPQTTIDSEQIISQRFQKKPLLTIYFQLTTFLQKSVGPLVCCVVGVSGQ